MLPMRKENRQACNNVGVILRDSEAVRDIAQASTFFRRACELGNGDGCLNEASHLDQEGSDPAAVQALKEKACQSDMPNAVGCKLAALSLAIGKDIPKDLDRAIALGTRGCELREATACFNLGLDLQETGPKALEAFSIGCELGYVKSCHNAGVLVALGKGVAADLVRARGFFDTACEKGDVLGCQKLSMMATEGEGGPVDHELAARAMDKACQLGEGRGCLAVADALWSGEHLTQNREEAAIVYARACELGQKRGCKLPKAK